MNFKSFGVASMSLDKHERKPFTHLSSSEKDNLMSSLYSPATSKKDEATSPGLPLHQYSIRNANFEYSNDFSEENYQSIKEGLHYQIQGIDI